MSRLSAVGLLAGACVLWAPPAAAQAMSSPDENAAPAPWAGRVVRSIDLEGNIVTRENVIRREIHTAVGAPLDLETLREDYLRLENLEIFSAVRIEAGDGDAGGVRLRFDLKESPSALPLVAFTYTEENGFSVGAGISALNLAGHGIKLTGRAYFGGTTQFWGNLVIRPDLKGFSETDYRRSEALVRLGYGAF